ncbi:putative DNA binding domain-containing protein [Kribbella sp. NBC_00482]|uniref:RNA-binding domain-containing protein n=1 Tax=Kribbella sp. NBC_00482 TaxID=2975968 RepID=UPI002E19E5EC
MNPPAAHEPPFALDGSVTRDKLTELLSVQTELPWLDYKRESDLSTVGELVELTKDVGAMNLHGGYLVIGVDDSGAVIGLSPEQVVMFDEAKLRGKLGRYLPPGFEVRCAIHELDDGTGPKKVALIWVAPHPDGWCIFARNGEYPGERGRTKIAFRAGDVYARHGTSSEPWNQADINAARRQLIARAKDSWRAEHADETRRALKDALADQPLPASTNATVYNWQLDAAGFETATVELIRHEDDIPIRRMLQGAAAEARRLVAAGGDDAAQELGVVLDRITAVAALGLSFERPRYFSLALRTLLDLYGWPISDIRVQSSNHRLVPALWLRIAERLYALGGLAVRLRNWVAIRELALAPIAALQQDSPGRTWHRDALTQASNARLFTDQQPDGQVRELSLLLFARAVAADQPSLRPDLPETTPETPGSDPLLTSISEFDLLATAIAGTSVDAEDQLALLLVSYPNFARFDSRRLDDIVMTLIFDTEARQALVADASDAQLARVLKLADEVAQREGRRYWGWEGFTDSRVRSFVSNH